MAFCSNCGYKLSEGSNFCNNCGAAVNLEVHNNFEKRKTTYEGEIHKCPNCGEILNSFVANCPSCGYEVRGNKASNSVKEFAMRLSNVENDKQKITIIQSFPIPNNKEDILEFLILAATCFDPSVNSTGVGVKKDVSDAWRTKVEQSYQKAKMLFANEAYFSKIQNVYNQTCTRIKESNSKAQNKRIGQLILRTIGLWGGLLVFIIGFFIDILPTAANTSVLHLGGGTIMIIGALMIGRKSNGMAEVGVGAATGLLAILLGMLLEESFHGNGSVMVLSGGATLIITVIKLIITSAKK
ncbi:zinc ribbon domain-containing protein [uncultured Ruminococcus sp.]|uniref:zinc ribbon domain-containing protein n=1 Tax=uncultured Ruminococcus sp. TaxID=165186 RepID=UPI0025DFD5E6|nr:zinc ribbon domain-containing protein [uncultured Ruminococcus sp.]